jgi:hypothetical protein
LSNIWPIYSAGRVSARLDGGRQFAAIAKRSKTPESRKRSPCDRSRAGKSAKGGTPKLVRRLKGIRPLGRRFDPYPSALPRLVIALSHAHAGARRATVRRADPGASGRRASATTMRTRGGRSSTSASAKSLTDAPPRSFSQENVIWVGSSRGERNKKAAPEGQHKEAESSMWSTPARAPRDL